MKTRFLTLVVCFVLQGGVAAFGQYSYLPSPDVKDSKMFAVIGQRFSSMGPSTIEMAIEVRQDLPNLDLGVFDGDSKGYYQGGHWDSDYNGPHPLLFSLAADPGGDGANTIPIGQWLGQDMTDNDWYSIIVPNTSIARLPRGTYAYRLKITSLRPNSPANWNCFKLRVNGLFRIDESIFTYLSGAYGLPDVLIVNPNYPSLTPTTYDGIWLLTLYLAKPVKFLEFYDGDFDYGGPVNSGDSDDPNTPNNSLPTWAIGSEALFEGRKGNGNPNEDPATSNWTTRPPGVQYDVIDPMGTIYTNSNPSGNSEWEKFRIDTAPFDPAIMDFHADSLPAGLYTIRIYGLNGGNTVFLKFFNAVYGQDENGNPVINVVYPPEVLCTIGDYVWHDRDQDGQQDGDEPPLRNVTLRLVNDLGYQIAKTRTDANGWYLFKNVPAGTYTVYVDAETAPTGFIATTSPSPYPVTVRQMDRFIDADFGFATGYGNGGCREVFAWYEPWFASASSDSALRHWDYDKRGGISDSARFDLYHQPSPVEKLFDSQDQHIWEHDILLAWAADIDAFVVNWHGQNAFEQTATRGLLETAQNLWEKYADQGFDFRIIIAYDEQALGNLDDNLRFIADSLLIQPAYYHGREGLAAGSWEQFPRPLFVFCPDQSLDPAGFRNSADTNLPDDVQIVWNWDGEYTELKDHVDSVYPWVMASNGHWDDLNGLEWGEGYLDTFYQKADTLGIKFLTGAVWPGFDDRPWSFGQGHWIDRQNALVYQNTWDKAVAHQPQWLLIESWNDFNRGSHIQIGKNYQDKFVKLTRDKSSTWKGGKPCARMIPDLGLQVPESLIQARKRGLDDSIIEYALDCYFNAQYSQALAILRPTDPLDLLNGGNQLVFFSGSPSHPGQEWSNAVDNDLDGWDGTATVKPAGLQTDPVSAIFGFASQGLYEFDYVTIQTDNGSDDNAVANRQAELVEILVSITGVKDADFTSVARLKIKQSKMTWYNLGKLVKARYVKLVILQPQYGKGGWRQVVEFGVNSKDKKGAKPVSEETQLAVVPEEFRLEQNYPNPFNPETTIEYTLPEETLVRLAVYDLMGRQVATLVNEPQQPGVHRVIWNAAEWPSGVYLYKITAGTFSQSKRMLVIK